MEKAIKNYTSEAIEDALCAMRSGSTSVRTYTLALQSCATAVGVLQCSATGSEALEHALRACNNLRVLAMGEIGVVAAGEKHATTCAQLRNALKHIALA